MTPEHPSEREPCRRRLTRDAGTTYIELLISLVLIGTAVIAILTAVRATTLATRIDEEQTRALSALLTAADELYLATPADCDDGPASVYDGLLTAAEVSVVEVEYLGRVDADADLTWGGAGCAEDRAHRITLAYWLDGVVIETYQSVKRE